MPGGQCWSEKKLSQMTAEKSGDYRTGGRTDSKKQEDPWFKKTAEKSDKPKGGNDANAAWGPVFKNRENFINMHNF